MEGINKQNLILEKEVFMRTEIERRMTDGGFNSLAKFELFIWDLEMFLQLQKKLGDKILLKGGAATQFYIPITAQRTSIDIDMICLATREEVYDVITLFVSNMDQIIADKELIKLSYEEVAKVECKIHNISYETDRFFEDMKFLINRVKNIESDRNLLQRANDFQALYLRNVVSRDKAQWAIVGYQLDLLADYIFNDDTKILRFREIQELIDKLKFENVRGPERGRLNKEVRSALEANFKTTEGLSLDLFKKRIDRIIWELVNYVSIDAIKDSVRDY